MKRKNIKNLTLCVIASLLASCADDAVFNSSGEDQELQTYTLYLDSDVPSFETGHEGETRASGNSWEDGDVIYVSFSNEGDTIVSKATYKGDLGAFQFASVSLKTASDANCSVYYFRGGKIESEFFTIHINQYTAIFCDQNAKYTCSNYSISLNASFKPYTTRICVKGEKDIQLRLGFLSPSFGYIEDFNLKTGEYNSKSLYSDLQIQADGYTPYVYGLFSNTNCPVFIDVGDKRFFRTLDSTELTIGESGYFIIPSDSDLHGWRRTTGTIDGHEYVDLGLPSGTLWSTCNIGATDPEEMGDLYSWGETDVKNTYDWNTYLHCDGTPNSCHYIGDDITGTEYDVARVKWGESWRMPTLEQIKELIDNCISLPMAVVVEGSSGVGSTGHMEFYTMAMSNVNFASILLRSSIWSSSLTPSNYCYAYGLGGIGFNIDCLDYELCDGLSVRAVSNDIQSSKPINPIADAIDLGLPSGTKWASWNIGASSPEEYGGYYAWGETEEKEYYDWSTYIHCDGSSENCHNIGDDIAGTKYDVAHVKWGFLWRMPSSEQIEELFMNCKSSFTTQNGVNGQLLTGPNGATIFLPAAGGRWLGGLNYAGSLGYYWSSTRKPNSVSNAYDLSFQSGDWGWGADSGYRSSGFSVRAVRP